MYHIIDARADNVLIYKEADRAITAKDKPVYARCQEVKIVTKVSKVNKLKKEVF